MVAAVRSLRDFLGSTSDFQIGGLDNKTVREQSSGELATTRTMAEGLKR